MFRVEALEYRLRSQGVPQDIVIFPRWMSRRIGVALWMVLALLGIGGGAACFVPVPVTASGLAIVANGPDTAAGSASIAALMPGAPPGRFEINQPVTVFSDTGGASIRATVTAIEPAPLGAAELEQRLGLPPMALASLGTDITLVWATLDSPLSENLKHQGFGRVELAAGSRPAGAFLPLVGRLFGGGA
jgi:hypothetical protein